jgi:lipopolysaccharide export system protein LptA
MRNREAARYARWSAGIAVAICLVVLGVYLHLRARDRAGGKTFAPVPATVAQQSAGFAISRVIGTRTLFTVHASQATQFKDENRSLLENVQIAIYGPQGDRNDSVRAGECSYEPNTGSVRCQGAVQIDLRNAKSSAQKSELHVETSDILFDHDSEVTTDKPVTLKFSGGEGTGVGLVYAPQSENVKLEKNVQLEIVPPQKSSAVPVHVTSSALEFRRSENLLRLFGPVRLQQDTHTLTAGALDLQLDAAMQPERAVATGNPQIVASGARGKVSFAADQMTTDLSPSGAIQKITADENVRGDSSGRDGENHLSAQHAEIFMNLTATGSEPREILAQGNVKAKTNHGNVQGNLATESLRVELSPSEGGGERVASAETLAPGKVVMTKPTESDQLQGGRLSAIFGAQSQLSELHGSSGVRVERKLSSDPLQMSTAQNLLAKFGSDGNWQTIDESGNVKFRQGDQSGAANTAQLSRATNEMTLTGSASVEDSASHLQAVRIRMNQTTNEMSASGNVVASFAGQKGSPAANPAAGSAQISADEMNGVSPAKSANPNSSNDLSANVSTNLPNRGHAVFSGHARLWQGADVLQAQTIEFWQDENRTEARGDALGAFVEAPHDTAPNGGPNGTPGGAANAKPVTKTAPVLWQVHAPKVDYWSDSGKMDWSGGVEAQSSEGAMTSQTLEMLFSKDGNNQQTMERAIAAGKVRIQQNGRTGTAERGEYVARDGKFILSGGQPTLADSSGNTTTGHELTFFLASDTVLVDSQNDKTSDK